MDKDKIVEEIESFITELDKVILANNNAITANNSDTSLDNDTRDKRNNFLTDQNNEIEKYKKIAQDIINKIKAINDIDPKKDKKIKSLCSDEQKARKALRKATLQGRLRDRISSTFGNLDKRIHNFWYNPTGRKKKRIEELRKKIVEIDEQEKLGTVTSDVAKDAREEINKEISKLEKFKNTRWKDHCDNLTGDRYGRYNHPWKYFGKFFGLSCIPLVIGTVGVLASPIVAPGAIALIIAGSIPAVITGVKTITTIVNKDKYGGPRLEREYSLPSVNDSDYRLTNSQGLQSVFSAGKAKLSGKGTGSKAPKNSARSKAKEDRDKNLGLCVGLIESKSIENMTVDEIEQIGDVLKQGLNVIAVRKALSSTAKKEMLKQIQIVYEIIKLAEKTNLGKDQRKAINLIRTSESFKDKLSDKVKEKRNAIITLIQLAEPKYLSYARRIRTLEKDLQTLMNRKKLDEVDKKTLEAIKRDLEKIKMIIPTLRDRRQVEIYEADVEEIKRR